MAFTIMFFLPLFIWYTGFFHEGYYNAILAKAQSNFKNVRIMIKSLFSEIIF